MKPILFSLFVLVFSPVLGGCLSPAEWEVARICGTQPNDPSCQTARDRATKERESEREWNEWSESVREDRNQESQPPMRIGDQKWISWLDSLDITQLEEQGKKYPAVSWLAGTWCAFGIQDLPAHYFQIASPHNDKPIEQIAHAPKLYTGKAVTAYKHIVVSGDYYDLWTWAPHDQEREKFDLVRLEKRSDSAYAVVYKKDFHVLYKYLTYDAEKNDLGPEVKALVEKKSAKIGPAEHSRYPDVFTRCDYRPGG